MTWRRRKGTEAAAERARVEAEVAGREAVRVAEQLVSSTWVAQLLRSEQNARDAVRAYRHLRAAAANGLREAQIAGHPQLVARRQAEVENLDVALADSTEYCDAVAATVGTELDTWSSATRIRVAQRLADRGQLREVGVRQQDEDEDAEEPDRQRDHQDRDAQDWDHQERDHQDREPRRPDGA